MAPAASSTTMQPLEPAADAFYKDLVATKLQNAPIVCGIAADKNNGKGIFAGKALTAGEPVWTEAPFVAMQHEDNKEFVDACGNCFVPLIDSKDAWDRVQESNADVADAATFEDFEAVVAFLQKEGGKSAEESYFSVFHLAAAQVTCPQCDVVYCSAKCRTAAYNAHHALLCTHAVVDATSPMALYMNHTCVTNEIFQLAAKVLATTLQQFIQTHDMATATTPLAMFCKLPWWDVITSDDDVDLDAGETLESYRERFKSLLQQTFELFTTALHDNLQRLAAADALNGVSVDQILAAGADVLTFDCFSRIVGMFEMNNISMEIDHPFHALSEALSEAASSKEAGEGEEEETKTLLPAPLVRVKNALEKFADEHKIHFHEDDDDEGEEEGGSHTHGPGCSHAHDHSHDHAHDHEDDDDAANYADDDDFVGVEGTALFSGVCTMNHSCDPNCTVLYTKDGAAHVFAVQDIAEGEELTISYIDVDQDVADRHECLREYQFVCKCKRCEMELKA